MDSLKQAIAKEIGDYRRGKMRWGQQTLAERSGVPYGTLRKIEDGTSTVDLDQLERITRAFGMTVTEFLRMVEEANPDILGPVSVEEGQDPAPPQE